MQDISKYKNFEDYRDDLIERILLREQGISHNPLECIYPESYINNPIQEISFDKIDNMPSSAIVTKHGLEWCAEEGIEPGKGAFHGIRLGKKVDIPIAVKANEDGTFSIVDGFHRAVQVFVNGDKTISAFVEGGSGKTLKDVFDSIKIETENKLAGFSHFLKNWFK